jgi:hypothetical protein
MLRSIRKLEQFRILAADSDVGSVTDTYFDDGQWVVRYLIVDASDWLHDRKVLISPHAVTSVDWNARAIATNLSRTQIQASPSIDTDKPVSRQHESEYHRYYGYPEYWINSGRRRRCRNPLAMSICAAAGTSSATTSKRAMRGSGTLKTFCSTTKTGPYGMQSSIPDTGCQASTFSSSPSGSAM